MGVFPHTGYYRRLAAPHSKRFLISFSCSIALLLLLALRVHAVTVHELIAEINPENYRLTLTNLFVSDGQNRGFTGGLNGNVHRVPAYQHDAARDYIYNALESLGLETRLDPFWFTRTYGSVSYIYTNCNNVLAVQYGVAANAGWHIIGAHYDSVDPGQFAPLSPGADDNASGVAAVLELARVLSRHTFRDHIIYIAFDAEEKGLKGSWHFVDTHTTADTNLTNLIQRADVRGMISLDMLAYNPAGMDHNKARIYGGSSSANAAVQVALRDAITNFTPVSVVHSGAISASDHYPFHVRGMDACLLIEHQVWSNPHYHKTTDSIDTPDNIDYAFATELTRGVAAYCAEQAGVILPATLSSPAWVSASEVVIAWSAQPDAVYRVQYTGDLMDGEAWQTLMVVTNVFGWDTISITNQVGTIRQRFYRVEHVYEP